MKISRQVGTTNERLSVFVQDATVTTGAGLANLVISTFSSYWCRDDNTSTSSVTLTSSTALGTYSSGAWTQINSTFMLGWYQFGCPNGVFASSRTAAIHMYGHPSMAPLPIEVEITKTDNQSYVSSQPHNITRVYSDVLVTTAAGVFGAGPVGVSSVTDKAGYGVSSIAPVGVSSVTDKAGYSVSSISAGVTTSWFSGGTIVTSATGVLAVDVSSIQRGSAVTTAAGILAVGRVGVSSMNIGVAVTTLSVPVDVTSFYGTAAVTTSAGILAYVFDLSRTANPNSTVAFSSFSISTSVSSLNVGAVDVTSFFGSRLVTSAAGVAATDWDLARVLNAASSVILSGFNISSVRASVSSVLAPLSVGSVNVSSFAGGAIVTSASGILTVNVSTLYGSNYVTSAAGIQTVNLRDIYGSGAVTSAAGILAVGQVGVSSFDIRVGVSSFGLPVGVSSMAIGVGVTTFNSRVGVSSFNLPVGVSSMTLGVDITSVVGIAVTGLGTSTTPWGPV